LKPITPERKARRKPDAKPAPATRGRRLDGPASAVTKSRFQLRDHFFAKQIDAKQLLEAFNQVPGLLYFVKDAQSRLMAISREAVVRMGFQSEEEIIGRALHEYLPRDLADKYLADERAVVRRGKPLRNIVEIYYNERGICDSLITDKYPLRDARGRIVGLIGTVQTFEGRLKLLAHIGPVGKAADFIRAHLGEPVMLADIARHSGFSERQLQRLFLRVFGITMRQFVIRSRVQAAIRELIHSNRTISEIACLFGFSDQSAFTNQFRDVTGMPPGIYRKRYFAQFGP
jgi:AraC-like DNA-binding protein